MKANRDANDLAARLMSAANTPLQVPQPVQHPAMPPPAEAAAPPTPGPMPKPTQQPPTAKKGRPPVETTAITLRPSKELLTRYTLAAAERTKVEGRVVSAQEIMLERLEAARL